MSGGNVSRRSFLGGGIAAAVALGAATADPRPAAFARSLSRRVPDPERFVLTRWAEDPYAFGSYSFIGVGGSNDDRRWLADPLGDGHAERVLFVASRHLGRATTPPPCTARTSRGSAPSRRWSRRPRTAARRSSSWVRASPGWLRRAHSGTAATRSRCSRHGGESAGRVWTDHSTGLPLDLGAG